MRYVGSLEQTRPSRCLMTYGLPCTLGSMDSDCVHRNPRTDRLPLCRRAHSAVPPALARGTAARPTFAKFKWAKAPGPTRSGSCIAGASGVNGRAAAIAKIVNTRLPLRMFRTHSRLLSGLSQASKHELKVMSTHDGSCAYIQFSAVVSPKCTRRSMSRTDSSGQSHTRWSLRESSANGVLTMSS